MFVDVQRAMYDGISFGVTPSRIIVSPGNVDGIVSPCYIVKAIDRRSGEQIWPLPIGDPLKVSRGKQKVAVQSLHAFDNELSYFAWAQFGPQNLDVRCCWTLERQFQSFLEPFGTNYKWT